MGLMELLCTGKGELQWNEYEEPELSSGQVRIASQYSVSKHGTKMALYNGYEMARGAYHEETQLFAGTPSTNYCPVPVGNMFVGPVVEKYPDVTELAGGRCSVRSWRFSQYPCGSRHKLLETPGWNVVEIGDVHGSGRVRPECGAGRKRPSGRQSGGFRSWSYRTHCRAAAGACRGQEHYRY
jgi:hypothetical protein